ncbi:hypothetical protein FACS189440_22250 [Bacteroidia bacterium]|nr:hypothetical protein FACS189440_22250 [Bacteroidia bacterium]
MRKDKAQSGVSLIDNYQLSIVNSESGKIRKKGQTVDALALGGDEGRDKLR